MAGRRGRHEEEEHENHERWLVTYADMVTLLMVLFIVMFAMSTVDEKKFTALKAGLAAGFGQSTSIMDGSQHILDDSGTLPNQALAGQASKLTKAEQEAVAKAVTKLEQQRQQRAYADAQAEAARLTDVQARLEKALAKHHLSSDVETRLDERGLVVSLVSKHVVFESDLARLTARGAEIVDTLAPVLAELPDPLDIQGHTNQVDVKPRYFDSDWDLSAARAITVLRRLASVGGIPDARLAATGFGHTKPLRPPDEPGSQEVNKRVDIVVESMLPEETRALLGTVVAEESRTGAAARTAPGSADTPGTTGSPHSSDTATDTDTDSAKEGH